MRFPLAPGLLTVAALLALAASAAALPALPSTPIDVSDLPAAALAAPGLGEGPALVGPASIVAHAAEVVQAGPTGPEDLAALAAQQDIVAALEPAVPSAWTLGRTLASLPLPAASIAAPAVVPELVPAPARAAVVAVGAAGMVLSLLPRVPLLPMYSRIQREEAMLNGRRNQLYELVRSDPGIHLSDLVRRSGLGWGAALYHLSVLEKNRVLVVHAEGGFKRYFANGAQSHHDLPRIAALRHGAAKALYEAVHAWPGKSGRELADTLGLSPSTLARASERLEDAGLVRRVRAGRRMLYFPAEAAVPMAAPASAAA
ncbi:MAG TPA: winged helix-turn-helix transcriptional regulator [Candidatus Thermoplasmatota archaeon]|jgi:DNA-binding transcriptional ArsR family regulator|nr:winged helix-turn-helix transcriptional regulator [Candidatus Thermoplasmatota archaeon]